MRTRLRIAALVSASAAGLALAAAIGWAALPAGELPAPIATRQTAFSIPFTLPAAAEPGAEPVEVRLFSSVDQGRSWTIAGRAGPKETSFIFKAPRDGEYWFLIRTVDRSGHLRPENGRAPELRVVVDTMPPRLDVSAARAATGEITAHCTAVDPLLKADSLIVEYQVAGDRSWHAVSFEPPRDDPGRSTTMGDITWRPLLSGQTTVRAEIRDRAGNVAVATTTVRDGGVSGGSAEMVTGPALTAPDRGPAPRDTRLTTPAATPLDAPAGGNGPFNAAPYRTQPPPSRSSDADRHDLTARSSPGGTAWPADHITSKPLFGADPNGAQESLAQDRAASRGVESRPNPAVADRVGAPVENAGRVGAVDSTPAVPTTVYTAGLRPGERPYMVNSKKFALEYEVESVGQSGISKIEIWGTRDGGHTWASYGVEPAQKGPVRVAVDAEGLYGFRITVRDGNGIGGRAPAAGDLPELWVGVDLTKPVARIVGAELGAREHAGELIIRWEARDAVLAARPVTLLFSDRRGGPWSTIAAGLENTGVYSWRFDNRAPEQVYLRLEVRDDAGNVGEFETQTPVSLSGNRPAGHLRNVPPNSDEAGQAYPWYR